MIKAIINEEGIVSDFIDYEKTIDGLKKEFKLKCVQNSVDDEVMNVILRKREEKRTFADLKKIILRKELEDDFNERIDIYENKYLEFIPSPNTLEMGEFDDASTFDEKGEDGKIYQRWVVNKNNRSKILDKIAELKTELSGTDYIIIKAYEAKLSMSDAPYPQEKLDEIIQHRQELRNKINELGELLK